MVWCSGSALVSINEVNSRRARLVLRWVSVSGFISRCRIFISVCNQPVTQGQLSLPSLPGSVNEDQLRLGRKRQVLFIPLDGRTRGVHVHENCEINWERVTYLSALEVCSNIVNIYLTLPSDSPRRRLNQPDVQISLIMNDHVSVLRLASLQQFLYNSFCDSLFFPFYLLG